MSERFPTVEQTIARLHKTTVPMKAIADAANVKLRWVFMLRDGQIPEPGVRKFVRLVDAIDKLEPASKE